MRYTKYINDDKDDKGVEYNSIDEHNDFDENGVDIDAENICLILFD